jgi:hypothetical protein
MSANVIRAWAKSRNIEVSERGRIPNEVVTKYQTWRTKADARNEKLRKARKAAKAA